MTRTDRLSGTNWRPWYIGGSLLFIATTIAKRHFPVIPDNPLFATEGRLLDPVNLAGENNIAAWWSGVWLFVAALLAYDLALSLGRRTRVGFVSLALVLAALSCDEISSIHERVGTFRDLVPYAAGAGVLLLVCLIQLASRDETRRAAVLIACGFGLFATVALQEHLEHTLRWPRWARGLRAGVEEGTELAGIYLLLAALVGARPDRPGSALPGAGTSRFMPAILLCGLGAQIVASLTLLPRFDDYHLRGNPTAWYPACVYLILAFECLRRRANHSGSGRDWLILSAALVFCSVDSVAAFATYVPTAMPGAFRDVPEHYYAAIGAPRYLLHLALLAVVGMRVPDVRSRRNLGILAAALLTVGASVVLARREFQFVVPAIVAYAMSTILLSPTRAQPVSAPAAPDAA